MPTPIYILCSESGALDRFSSLVSVHNIIEKILIIPRGANVQQRAEAGQTPWLQLRISAAWKSMEEDAGQQFEYEVALHLPGKDEIIVSSGEFLFKARIHRFIVGAGGPPPQQAGTLAAISRVRRVGDTEWFEQCYEIDVELATTPETTEAGQ